MKIDMLIFSFEKNEVVIKSRYLLKRWEIVIKKVHRKKKQLLKII